MDKLPVELEHHILDFLDFDAAFPAEWTSYLLVCSRWREHLEPVLYHEIAADRDWESIELLVRTFDSRPELALLVHVLNTECLQEHRAARFARLLGHCTKVENLDIQVERTVSLPFSSVLQSDSLLALTLGRGLKLRLDDNQEAQPLPGLSTLFGLIVHPAEEAGEALGSGSIELKTLLSAPSLENLTLRVEWLDDPVAFASFFDPCAGRLTRLNIARCPAEREVWVNLIPTFTALTILIISPEHNRAILGVLPASLKALEIDVNMFFTDSNDQPDPEAQGVATAITSALSTPSFPKLKILQYSGRFGPYEVLKNVGFITKELVEGCERLGARFRVGERPLTESDLDEE